MEAATIATTAEKLPPKSEELKVLDAGCGCGCDGGCGCVSTPAQPVAEPSCE